MKIFFILINYCIIKKKIIKLKLTYKSYKNNYLDIFIYQIKIFFLINILKNEYLKIILYLKKNNS